MICSSFTALQLGPWGSGQWQKATGKSFIYDQQHNKTYSIHKARQITEPCDPLLYTQTQERDSGITVSDFKVRCESDENQCLLSYNITSGNRPVRQPNHSGSRQPSWGTRTESAGARPTHAMVLQRWIPSPKLLLLNREALRSTEKCCPSFPQTQEKLQPTIWAKLFGPGKQCL